MGLRGSGKTTIGRVLSNRTNLPWFDLDDRTPTYLGALSSAEALVQYGEPAFRAAEYQALLELLQHSPRSCIIALGGGTPTAPGVADLLTHARSSREAILLYLHASASSLRARLANTDLSTRPSLTGAPPLQEVDELYSRRDPLFRSLADAVIDADSETPGQLVDRIMRLMPCAS